MSLQVRGLRALATLRPLSRCGGRLGVEPLRSGVAPLSPPFGAASARTYARICSARGSLSRLSVCTTRAGVRQALEAAPQRCLEPRRQQRAVHTTTPASTAAAMDPEVLKHYLADSPPTVVPLAIKPHFEALNDQQKLYSHYLSMSARPAPVRPPAVVRECSPELCIAALGRHKNSNMCLHTSAS